MSIAAPNHPGSTLFFVWDLSQEDLSRPGEFSRIVAEIDRDGVSRVTSENRKRNIADELARADEALRAADARLELGLHADSVSRAYYGALHCLRALLLSRGVEAKTHAGAIHVFNVEFVRAGVFASSHNRLLAGILRSRQLAD